MSFGEEKAKRWRIGIRGVLYFITAIATSLGLVRFASTANDYPAHWLIDAAIVTAFVGGMFMFGGAVGGLLGHLIDGSKRTMMKWAIIGGVLNNIFCCGVSL